MLHLILLILTSFNLYALDCNQYELELSKWNENSLKHVEDPSKIHFSNWVPTQGAVQSVMLSIHGLNNNASTMMPLNIAQSSVGVESLNVVLLGNRGNHNEAKFADFIDTVEQVNAHYCMAKARAKKLQVPLILMGFSLGASHILGLLQEYPEERKHVQQIIIFAPAVALTLKSSLIQYASVFPRDWVLVSFTDESVRANDYTPMNLYDHAYQAKLRATSSSFESLNDVKATIIMDPNDQLIDYEVIKNISDKNSNWQLHEFSTANGASSNQANHLVVREIGLGNKEWSRLKSLLVSLILK